MSTSVPVGGTPGGENGANGNPDVPRLYRALELTPLASAQEIRSSYRKLALKCHPDKAGEAGVERFQQIQEAYGILSDEKKRKVYDAHGERGLEMLNNPYAGGIVSNLETHVLLVFFGAGLLLFTTLLVIFMSFLAARVDGKTKMNWASVMSPIWVWDIVWGGFLLYVGATMVYNFSQPLTEEQQQDAETMKRRRESILVSILGQLINWCYIIFTILIGIGLSSKSFAVKNWWSYFIPFFLAELCILFLSIPSFKPSHIRQQVTSQGVPMSHLQAVVIAGCNVVVALWRIPLGLLICANIAAADSSPISWYVVCLPLYLLLIAALTSQIVFTNIRVSSDPELTAGHGVVAVLQHLVVHVMLLISILLVCDKLEGGTRTLGVALIPLFLLVCLMWVFSLILLLASCRTAEQELRKEEEMEEMRRQARDESEPNANENLDGGAGSPPVPPMRGQNHTSPRGAGAGAGAGDDPYSAIYNSVAPTYSDTDPAATD